MKYFDGVTTLNDLKAVYRKLAMKHHPDRGGDTETMKAINAEHDALFEILKEKQNAAADADKTGKTYRTTESAKEFRDILNILLRLDGVEVELCGAWLWISGDTLKHKEQLKNAGCKWSRSRHRWYWHHPEQTCGFHRGKVSMDYIRMTYGSQEFKKSDGEMEKA